MEKKKQTISLEIDTQRVVDLFISACEGGSNYWCRELTPKGKHRDPYEAMLGGFAVIEMENGKKHTVSRESIQKALGAFPSKYPRHFADWIAENDDAETADVFLQLCVFGDAIYG